RDSTALLVGFIALDDRRGLGVLLDLEEDFVTCPRESQSRTYCMDMTPGLDFLQVGRDVASRWAELVSITPSAVPSGATIIQHSIHERINSI
ncbi:hypothetical protein PR001_g32146, partial [Phytophthora rubi]